MPELDIKSDSQGVICMASKNTSSEGLDRATEGKMDMLFLSRLHTQESR